MVGKSYRHFEHVRAVLTCPCQWRKDDRDQKLSITEQVQGCTNRNRRDHAEKPTFEKARADW